MTKKNSLFSIALLASVMSGSTLAAGLTNTDVSSAGALQYRVFGLDEADCMTSVITPPGNPSAAQDAVFQGDETECIDGVQAGPGSNMELGPNPDGYSADATVLMGDLPINNTVTLSELTQADWNSNIGGLTVAQKYIMDAIFVGCGITTFDPVELTNLALAFVNVPVPPDNIPAAARLGDPNISFVNEDTDGQITIGLAGLLNAKALIPLTCPDPIPTPDIIQASEVVKYSGTDPDSGVPFTNFLYSFNGLPSGVVSNDGTNSHNATYLVKPINDPPNGEKVGMVDGFPVLLWQMKWVNPNSTSVAVKVADPINQGQTFEGSPNDVECTGMLEVPGITAAPVCEYDPGSNSVIFEGLIGPGGSVSIIFRVSTQDPLPADNTAFMCWDTTGDGVVPDLANCEEDNGVPPISAEGVIEGDPEPPQVPTDVPVLGFWGMLLLSSALSLIGGLWQRHKQS